MGLFDANTVAGPSQAQLEGTYDQSQAALAQQQAFIQALQAQGGIGNQTSVFNQQQQLANQLQGMTQGQGPNPAQAALNQATGQNVANQAALMAGQRGASGNVGLMARQAAQQGANTQQQAVGQGATLQAQQQLAAINALQGQQNMLGNLATTQVGQQASANQNQIQGSLGEQNIIQGAQNDANSVNAQIGLANAKTNSGLLGGLLGGITSGAGLLSSGGGGGGSSGALAGGSDASSMGSGAMLAAKGGMAGAGGEPKSHVTKYFKNKGTLAPVAPVSGEMLAAQGMTVPGKAKVKGDSYKNDTIDAKLSPGEIVIPRHITQNDNAPKMAAQFVQAILAKQGKGMKRG